MRTEKKILVLALALGCFSMAPAQDITRKIENYAIQFSPERAYIHFDKSAYSPGETVWFKAYLMNEIVPANDSKTFYIDWMDEKGNLLQHTVSPLISAMSSGQFDIPAAYKGKTVSVRAYTRWMLNFDSAFLFSKTLPVINKDSLGLAKKPLVIPRLEFFPEGGDAVAGMTNKIAFKASDQWGRPVKIKGVLIAESGEVIDSLRIIHDGMGFVQFIPKPGVAYKAKWKDENKKDFTTALPAIKSEGVVLNVAVLPGRRNFMAELSPSLQSKVDSLHIVGTMFQHVVFKISKGTSGGKAGAVIPTKDLPYGLMTITVFDQSWKPLAERVTFINNQTAFTVKPEMEVQRWGLSYRARDEIKITVPDDVASSLSVAVTDMALPADSSENIVSALMLTSELRGRIHNPAYYFSDTSFSLQQRLDLVMLTNGWRRFNWDQVLSAKPPKPAYPRDSVYMSLSGKVMGLMPGQIGNGTGLIVMIKQKDKEGGMVVVPVAPDGTFNDAATVIFDTAQVYYQFQDKNLKGSLVQFMPSRLRVPPTGKSWVQNLFPDTTGNAYQWGRAEEAIGNTDRARYKELETVTVSARGKSAVQKIDEKYTSGLFTGDGIQLDLINDPFAKSALDIFSYMQGKVAGLQITGSGSNASLNWRGGAPQLYIDEMPADVEFVSSVNVRDVAYIKAFRPPFMGGFNGSNGAIAIYTRRGGDQQTESDKGLPGSKIDGYSPIREFYSPKYYSREVKPGSDRDVRTTIYWNPNVVIDPQKKEVVLSFYNNDVTDAFRVVIQGMTTDGKLIHYTTTME